MTVPITSIFRFRALTHGNNGTFAAAPEWDACTGLGSPNGQKVADAV